jgi:hypothetical protein
MRHAGRVAALSIALFATTNAAGGVRHAELGEASPDGLPLRLVLALDGVPFDVFAALQERGHFSDFGEVRRMVATFPSLTDVSFAAMSGKEALPGYQVVRYDPSRNRVVGNTIRSLSGKAHQNLPADTRPRTVANRAFSYVRPYPAAVAQLRRMRDDFLHSSKATFLAYIEATDSLLHVLGRDSAERFLTIVETELAALADEVRRRTGRALAIDIVSDHGSTLGGGRRLRLERALRSCGFRRAPRLGRPRNVVYTQAGIIGSVALHAAETETERLAACVAAVPGVDLVAFRRGDHVVVKSTRGEAEVRKLGELTERYAYRPLDGDPLGLSAAFAHVLEGGPIVADQEKWFRRTATTSYPNAPRRIWRAFHGTVQHPPTVLVSLHDGYEAANGFVRMLGNMRGREGTHGSLTAAASLGLLVSNWRDVVDVDSWGARTVLFGAATSRALEAHVQAVPFGQTGPSPSFVSR